MYSSQQVIKIVTQLLSVGEETEICEFKKATNSFSDSDLGQYFSALSNEANLKNVKFAWMVFGIDDKSHTVVGTNYKSSQSLLNELKKKIADQTTDRITFEEIYDIQYQGERIVVFQIPAAPQGIPIAYKGHYYGRDGESLVALNINEIETIRRQSILHDWSAEIVNDATIDDLDEKAIEFARKLYEKAKPEKYKEIHSWDNIVFLNKAKLTIKNKITKTALLLLGKEESEFLLSPAVAQIKWVLKDVNGFERDYSIFHCPFLLAIDKVYAKIRNLKYRYINPEFQTLFPEEIDTYEPYVIREALNNAIAHQNYEMGGQINVVEYDDKLVFSNKGAFLPGSIDNVLQQNAPEEHYTNRFLADAMVGLKLVDTIGSGIRKMYACQKKRLFPMPIYTIENNRVEVSITGKILDMNYSTLLAKTTDLSLYEIELLNRVQVGTTISREEVGILRRKHLIEGRFPNVYIAKSIAQTVNKKVEYSKHKGLKSKTLEKIVTEALQDHKRLTKSEIVDILLPGMPDVLSKEKKIYRIQNLLTKMKKLGIIDCESRGTFSQWFLVGKE